MKLQNTLTTFAIGFLLFLPLFAGIIPAIIPSAVPVANKRGNSTVFQLAVNNSAATAGAPFCDDGSGNATTTTTGVVCSQSYSSFCAVGMGGTACGFPLTITVSPLGAANAAAFTVQCWTLSGTTVTPLAIINYSYTTSGGIVQTISPTFGAAATGGFCTASGTLQH